MFSSKDVTHLLKIVYFIDREPAHLFLDKTIWRLEKGTKVTDSKHGFKGCLLFENWRGLSFA
ncbi:hypothetical protein NQ315_000031 [Exocentrus adspersus]|uniref:Uncharacterized protein n=1 Tax=Exocentrus adspersus TaxID=1586481 RepID=A0AAV8VFR1_9CUCU|nr:hypothetical protein NQ315_000031 [Exocentrus adspersus]